ncbi:MAG: hypothetical protein ABSD56_08750, partial [Bryobacteraceae bacterium]
MVKRCLPYGVLLVCLGLVAAAQDNSAAQPGSGTAPKSKQPGDQTTPKDKKKQKSPEGSDIQYLDLVAPDNDHPKPKLPYGRPFTIIGRASEVCIKGKPNRDPGNPSCGDGGQRLVDLIAPTAVGGTYVVEGK